MLFENSDSDDENINVTINKKQNTNNKRKREEEENSEKELELNVLYNLYEYCISILQTPRITVAEFKRILDEWLNEIINTDIKKESKITLDLLNKMMMNLDSTYRPTKRARTKYKEILEKTCSITKNGLKEPILDSPE